MLNINKYFSISSSHQFWAQYFTSSFSMSQVLWLHFSDTSHEAFMYNVIFCVSKIFWKHMSVQYLSSGVNLPFFPFIKTNVKIQFYRDIYNLLFKMFVSSQKDCILWYCDAKSLKGYCACSFSFVENLFWIQ